MVKSFARLFKGGGVLGRRPKSLSAESEILLPNRNQENSKNVQWTILRKKPY